MKLWIVTVEFEYMCVAENERAATKFADEAASDVRPLSDCAYGREYSNHLADGWERKDYVYTKGADATVAEAIDLISAAEA